MNARRRLLLVAVLFLALCVWMTGLVLTSSCHAGQLRVRVDKQPAVCHPLRCVQLRTITYSYHRRVIVGFLQVRHRPTESRNAAPFMAAWRDWHTVASDGTFQ